MPTWMPRRRSRADAVARPDRRDTCAPSRRAPAAIRFPIRSTRASSPGSASASATSSSIRSAREMHSNGSRMPPPLELRRVGRASSRDESRTHRPRTRGDRGGSDRRSPRLRRRRSPTERRRCVVPNTERLHHVQVYGQPRAVMSDTGAEAVMLAPGVRGSDGRSMASRSGYGCASRSGSSARGRRADDRAVGGLGTRCRGSSTDRSGLLAEALAEAGPASNSSSVCSPSPTTTTSAPASRYSAA